MTTTDLQLAATGYVSSDSGSMAGANGFLLKALLERGCRIGIFSKADFVDPHPMLGWHENFRFHETVNGFADDLRRRVEGVPLMARLRLSALGLPPFRFSDRLLHLLSTFASSHR